MLKFVVSQLFSCRMRDTTKNQQLLLSYFNFLVVVFFRKPLIRMDLKFPNYRYIFIYIRKI